ncbi:MAG: 50S ribosomal protein L32 [Patescibacteria group bacterium]|jgi:ribosomal protein L32
MGLPGHRRTSSDKRRRASHFALTKPAITTSKTGTIHLSHRAAPGATEYNGHPIHVKGREKKLEKLLGTKAEPAKAAAHEHNHGPHEGHDHS